ncbi:MAG: RNA polymerase sigma factor [Solirubrobacteraceae bacterium]
MGEPDEFIALYERDAESVLLFLARRTLDAEIALDLTAETFVQAWRGWSAVRTQSREEVRAWLFVIARRALGHYLRRGRVERRALQQLGASVPRLHEDDLTQIERAAGAGRAEVDACGRAGKAHGRSARRACAACRPGAAL